MLTTIQKIGPVLELFTVERPEWRMSGIARELGTPKSSADSLVAPLAEIGPLSVGAAGSYRLGWNPRRGPTPWNVVSGPSERLMRRRPDRSRLTDQPSV